MRIVNCFVSWCLCLLVPGSLLTACKSSKSTGSSEVAQVSEVQDTLLVALKRGACFGACPQFECTIYKTGLAVYDGERNVKKSGIWKARLSAETLNEFRTLVRTYRIEEKDTVYINKYLADYPSYFITVSDYKPSKRIYVNHDQPPVEITSFVTQLERMMESIEWKNLQGLKSDE